QSSRRCGGFQKCPTGNLPRELHTHCSSPPLCASKRPSLQMRVPQTLRPLPTSTFRESGPRRGWLKSHPPNATPCPFLPIRHKTARRLMIPRYSRPEMVAIWDPETKFRIWFEIEAHACEALAEIGVIPKEAAKNIRERGDKAVFDVEKIDAIEREVKHDVIAFLTHLAEFIGEDSRFVHQGMTSSDVLDTCFNVPLARASDILLRDMDEVRAAIKRRAYEHKDTICIGRSHGIHAEPVTFGLKMAEAYAEFSRCRERLVNARKEIATCAISGAVGTFANIDPRVEEHVAKALGL